MQAFHIPAPPPYYTNTFLLISDAGHAVIIDPAADVQNYEQILQEHNAVLTTLLCTHGHFDHVGSAEALRRIGCEGEAATDDMGASCVWGQLAAGLPVEKGDALFPRLG